VIRRLFKNLGVLDPAKAPPESAQLEREGYALLSGVFDGSTVAAMREEIDAAFEAYPSERIRDDKDEFRYEMFNRSAACQAAIMHPDVLRVVDPLLGDDCHVIANTAWRNPPTFPGGPWHCDAGPHVPRAEGVEWDDRIPYPIFAIGAHLLLADCDVADGPTAVVPGSHRSGRLPPYGQIGPTGEVTYDGRPPALLTGRAGDVALFVSDCWHRGTAAGPDGRGRLFLQVHYGRRDLAQRLRTTDAVNHLSDDAIGRATTERERSIIGLHPAYFYDG